MPPRAVNSLDLLHKPTLLAQAELVWRLGMSIGAFNLVLLGIGLSAGKPRRPNNWNLMFALLSFVVYFNLINLSQSWVANGRSGPAQALLGVHGLVLALALSLIWWRDNGNKLCLPRLGTRQGGTP